MRNDDGTYDKPEFEGYWVCEGHGDVCFASDGEVRSAGCSIDYRDVKGRWLPITLPTFPKPPKPLVFEFGKEYRQRNGVKAFCVGFKLNGKPLFETDNSVSERYPSGTLRRERESEFDIIAEWTEPAERVKVPRLFRAKYRKRMVVGCYYPSETSNGLTDHLFCDEEDPNWCKAGELAELSYLTPEFEDELNGTK